MKIKTITCHEVYNYGASLQEYALLKYLEELGHESKTIRYKPPYLSDHFKLWKVSNGFFDKNIILRLIYLVLKFPSRVYNLKRKRAFDKFSKEHINSGSKLYHSNEELKNDVPEADVYICGSDQIWNSFFQNGKDPAFYLDFVPANKLKISYAASFAIDELEEDIKPFVKEKVSKIDFVSVRESSGVRILNNLDINDAIQVLDPVFLLSKEFWINTFNLEKSDLNYKYILIYDFDQNDEIKRLALRLKNQYSYKIITINEKVNYADKNFFLEGPIKFLSLIRHAEFVIANSFHAVAFSIIFKRKFVIFNRSDKINTRMRDLLALLKVPHLLISKESDFDADLNYSYASDELEKQIEKSKNFLSKSISSND
ncbi:polysaccharide pyruvyl transferase family protein [Hyunsoonleella ulvae]|uniref:polysaccharide pyruvyl transferase family protein n=1 Tax=Hyunsoonleella ulvae TaxID=2799948 RepID=UPI00193AD48F|nr:polysaccharide pyruvyl transferase family protein [Hyunsoonleella ulvae]